MKSLMSMIGREGERGRLSAFVTATEDQALVLKGETGVGKSALLDHVAEAATQSGHEVIRAAGVEAESGLPFAGLHQVLHTLLPAVERLDEVHRVVFGTAFGQSRGRPPSVMALGIAVLDLLGRASAARPLLLVVDDGQWLDAASTEVVGFVGRRLAGGAVRLVVGLRSEVASGWDTAGLPELSVPALSDTAAQELLDLRHPELDAAVRRLVLDHARGNPLALLELPAHLHRVGRQGTGERAGAGIQVHGLSVTVPRRLQHVYGTRIAALSDRVRGELLRGALDGAAATSAPGSAPGAGRLPGAVRYRMRDAEEAVAVGLLEVDPLSGDFVFRHPLVRSSVVQTATPNERRAAHAVLADVHRDDIERRATHLAASTIDPDEAVAATLEAAADSATRRGGAIAAVAWLTRAAELSDNSQERSRRLGSAAYIAGQAGHFDQAQRLLRSARAPGAAASPASVVTSAYVALFEDGDVRHTHRQVSAAIEQLRDRGVREPDEVLTRLIDLLLAISQYAGSPARWAETRALLGELAPARSLVYQDAWGDVVRHGAGVRERVEREFAAVADLAPWDVTRLAVAAYHVDTLSQYRPYLHRSADREAETGFVRNGMTTRQLIMLDQMTVGEWDEAERTGQRCLELTLSHGYHLLAHQTRAYLGLLAAMRGQTEHARQLQATVDTWARPRGVGFLTQITDTIGTTAALAEGDYEAAYLHAIGITPPGTFHPYAHQAPRTLLDLVEAALHTGRTQQAHQHAQAAHHTGLAHISPRLALTTYGALAMTTPDPTQADHYYHQAQTHPQAHHFPYELARIHLAHGTRQRHTHGPKTARHCLTLAAEAFERLGAVTWAERARAELRVAGVATHAPSVPSAELTWQERRIADLAASGLTNKEIGERMHLSPRTVSSHLYRVFPKLGITSRAALRDALARLEGEESG